MNQQIEQILVSLALFFVMVAIGGSVSKQEFREILIRPKAFATGSLVQLLLMPALAYFSSHIFSLDPESRLVLILIGCSPGGTMSNVFAWFARGHLALSISMTFLSSLLAIFFMPLSLELWYQRAQLGIKLPLSELLASMSFILFAVICGMSLRRLSLLSLARIQGLASFLGIASLLLILIRWYPSMHEELTSENYSIFFAIVSMSFAGFLLATLVAKLMGLDKSKQRSLAIEAGMQNTLLSFAVISLAFDESFAAEMAWIPIAYGLIAIVCAIVFVCTYRIQDKFRNVKKMELCRTPL